jgi:acyl carrier protein
MTKEEITDKVFEIVCRVFMIEKNEITPNSTFRCFSADFMDMVEVNIEIEKEFHITIPYNIALKFKSISSTAIIDYIASLVNYIDLVLNKKKLIK